MTVYLLAHGSPDPRHQQDVAAIAARLADEIGDHVVPCYLDHAPPSLAEAAAAPGVVVPLFFSPGYHVQHDVAAAVAGARAAVRVAEPPLLTSAAGWGRDLLAQTRAAWPDREVVLATAGSTDEAVLDAWDVTAADLGTRVVHASGPGRRLAELDIAAPAVVLPLLVARGFFGDRIAQEAAAAGLPVAAHAGASSALIARLAGAVRSA